MLRKAIAHNRKSVAAHIRAVSEDSVEVILSTDDLARDGHILETQGCILDNYLRNPIVLWQHDPDQPVGNCENIVVEPGEIRATIIFVPVGISAKADEVRGLVKSGVVRTMSIGFDWEAENATPLDPRKPRGGQRIHRWELFESSFVTVPADPNAVVTARANQEKQDMTRKSPARKLLAEYKRLFKTGVRGLYDVAQLAYLLNCVGNEALCAKFEAAVEGDESEVPGMLVDALKELAAAFVAMAEEESSELIEELEEDEEEEAEEEMIGEEDRAFIASATNKRVRALRKAMVLARAGKSLSKSNADALDEADQAHTRALKHHKALGEHHDAMREHMETMGACAEGVRSAMTACTRALDAAGQKPEDASDHLEKAQKAVGKANEHADKLDSAHAKGKDSAEDAHDSHAAVGRSIKAAQRAVKNVDGSNKEAASEDGDSKEIQKPEGDKEDEGSRADADFRRRQAEALALAR